MHVPVERPSSPLSRLWTRFYPSFGIILTALVLLAADWSSKAWIRASFSVGETHPVWPGMLDFTYVHNTGAAWSLFNAYPQYLLLLAAAFSVGLLVLIFCVPFRRPIEWAILALLLGGALGNLVDRIQFGAVTDFIDVPFIPDYPIFNIADSFIFCAVALMLMGYMRGVWPHRPS
jgi:signal peptidase II